MFKITFLKQSDGSVLGPEQTLHQSIRMMLKKKNPDQKFTVKVCNQYDARTNLVVLQ